MAVSNRSPIFGLFSVGLTGDMLRGLMAGLDRELDMLLSDEYAAVTREIANTMKLFNQ